MVSSGKAKIRSKPNTFPSPAPSSANTGRIPGRLCQFKLKREKTDALCLILQRNKVLFMLFFFPSAFSLCWGRYSGTLCNVYWFGVGFTSDALSDTSFSVEVCFNSWTSYVCLSYYEDSKCLCWKSVAAVWALCCFNVTATVYGFCGEKVKLMKCKVNDKMHNKRGCVHILIQDCICPLFCLFNIWIQFNNRLCDKCGCNHNQMTLIQL